MDDKLKPQQSIISNQAQAVLSNHKYVDKNISETLERIQSFEIHQKKLVRIKEELDKKKSSKMLNSSYENLKSQMMNNKLKSHEFHENEKITEIKRSNQILLDRLMEISKGKKSNVKQEVLKPVLPPSKSLNYVVKKKEAERIDKENHKIMERLVNQNAIMSIKKLEKDFSESRKYKQMREKSQILQIEKLIEKRKKLQDDAKKNFLPTLSQHRYSPKESRNDHLDSKISQSQKRYGRPQNIESTRDNINIANTPGESLQRQLENQSESYNKKLSQTPVGSQKKGSRMHNNLNGKVDKRHFNASLNLQKQNNQVLPIRQRNGAQSTSVKDFQKPPVGKAHNQMNSAKALNDKMTMNSSQDKKEEPSFQEQTHLDQEVEVVSQNYQKLPSLSINDKSMSVEQDIHVTSRQQEVSRSVVNMETIEPTRVVSQRTQNYSQKSRQSQQKNDSQIRESKEHSQRVETQLKNHDYNITNSSERKSVHNDTIQHQPISNVINSEQNILVQQQDEEEIEEQDFNVDQSFKNKTGREMKSQPSIKKSIEKSPFENTIQSNRIKDVEEMYEEDFASHRSPGHEKTDGDNFEPSPRISPRLEDRNSIISDSMLDASNRKEELNASKKVDYNEEIADDNEDELKKEEIQDNYDEDFEEVD